MSTTPKAFSSTTGTSTKPRSSPSTPSDMVSPTFCRLRSHPFRCLLSLPLILADPAGLSYTTFKLTNIEVSAHTDTLSRDAPANSKNLYDVLAWVSVDVCNTGDKWGTEVPQVYIGSPAEGAPMKVLRGFEATHLNSGETKRVTFELTRRDLR